MPETTLSPLPTALLDDARALPELLEQARDTATAFIGGLADRPAGCAPAGNLSELALPELGNGSSDALELFRQRFESGLSASPGPRYVGFVTGGVTPAALVGDWLVAAYDQNLATGGDSIAAAVERQTLAMLRQLFGLPDTFAGAFVSGATMANVTALAAARQQMATRLGIDTAEEGLWQLPRIPVLAGAPHASIAKAASMLGMGRRAIERLALVPGRQAMDPDALRARLEALDGAPAIVVASAGDVNTGDFDDLVALGELCRRHGAWLHVDGAFGLFARCDPDRADVLAGLEQADSLATDGHKWLNVPYDSGIVFNRHLPAQEQVFRASSAYLGDGPDLLHRTPENSRRFRALPAWMTLQAYGRAGYRAIVGRCCELAARLGQWLERSPQFELLAPVRLNIVCFALTGDDAATRDRFLAALIADGRVLVSQTHFSGRPALRAAFCNWSSTERDLDSITAALSEVAAQAL